jgi:HPt (histidine-containing phosphotransfer) domain-containing protein
MRQPVSATIDDVEGAVAPVPAGTADAATTHPINRAYLARFTLGNAALEREILELFAGQLPAYVGQLRAAADRKAWALAAHTIKGSALAVGARRLADAALAAEQIDAAAFAADAGARRQAAETVAAAADEAAAYVARLFT